MTISDLGFAIVDTPEKTTAAALSRYMSGRVVADSAALHWPGIYARRFQFPRVVDRFLVPATAEPHISCGTRASLLGADVENGLQSTLRCTERAKRPVLSRSDHPVLLPDVVARQVDVFPAERRQVPAQRFVQLLIVSLKRTNRPFRVHSVPQHDGRRH